MTIKDLPCPEPGIGPRSSSVTIGIVLSIVADLGIALSLAIMKHAHNKNYDLGKGKPRKHYIFLPFWWFGMVMNVAGELGNLISLGFAPASIVTPVGSVGAPTSRRRVAASPLPSPRPNGPAPHLAPGQATSARRL